MLKKHMTYKGYDGSVCEDDFYFHLNKAELFDWLICNGGYTIDQLIFKLQKNAKGKDILDIFRSLILQSYGEISTDGKRFIKDEEATKAFKETEAFSNLYIELVTDSKKAAEFLNGIMPDGIGDEIDKILKDNPDGIPDEVKDYLLGKTDVAPKEKVVSMPGTTGDPVMEGGMSMLNGIGV